MSATTDADAIPVGCEHCRECGSCDYGLPMSCTCGPCSCLLPCGHPACVMDQQGSDDWGKQ